MAPEITVHVLVGRRPAGGGWQVSGCRRPLGRLKNSQRSSPAEIIHKLPPNDNHVAEKSLVWGAKKKRAFQLEYKVHLQVCSTLLLKHKLGDFSYYEFCSLAAKANKCSWSEKISLTQDS